MVNGSELADQSELADRFELGGTGAEPAITLLGRTTSYDELTKLIDRVEFPSAGLLDLADADPVALLAAVFAAARDGAAVLVRAAGIPAPAVAELPAGAFLVAMTSGTSGRPRGVVRSVDSWARSFRPLALITGLTGADTVLLTGPLHTTLHLFAAVHTLWLGAHLTDDLVNATAVHAVPAIAAQLLADPPRQLRTVVCAGAATPAGVKLQAAERGVTLVEYYGAAELSFVAAGVAPAPLRPFPGVQVRIVDGVLGVRSPYLAMGRLGPGSQGLQPLRDVDGFATVGDLAAWGDDGGLTISGRGDAAVSTGGHTVVVEDVEAVLGSLPGVRAVAVVGVPHAGLGQVLTAAVELADGTELATVRRTAREVLTGPALPRRWQVVQSLPRTPNGKIARGAIAERLAAGGPADGRDSPGTHSRPGPPAPGRSVT